MVIGVLALSLTLRGDIFCGLPEKLPNWQNFYDIYYFNMMNTPKNIFPIFLGVGAVSYAYHNDGEWLV